MSSIEVPGHQALPGTTRHLSQVPREALFSALFLAGAIGVFSMWAHDTAPVRSAGEWLVALGRVTGLEGTYAALVVVLLLARVWWLEKLIGMDRAFWWHRWLGQATVLLLVAHACLIVWGYSVSFHAGFLHETKSVVLDLPDMLAATVALALFIVVGVVSVRYVRRRLKYQTWYFIHLYLYVAIALSFAHQFSTGADFASHPLNREIWVAMYAVVFALLLWYRVAVPLRSSLRHRLSVGDVIREADGTVSVYITGQHLSRLRAEPGQFFIWRFLTAEGWWQAHPFSLSAPPDDSSLRLTIRSSGDFTREIGSLRAGSRVIAEGPFGSFTARRRRRGKVLLVAAGAGIAPIRALFETLPCAGNGLTLLYRVSDESSLALREELDEIAARRGARVLYLVGNRAERPEVVDHGALEALVGDDLAQYDAYLCGPRGFMEAVRNALLKAGVPTRRIHRELFET